MPVNLSIDPVAAADAVFDISGTQSANRRAEARNEYWKQMDYRMDADKWRTSQLWRIEDQKRADSSLQRLINDAQKAGISPNAALGVGGSAPISAQIPMGQGGRASGTYQRRSPFESIASMSIAAKSASDIALSKKYEAEAFAAHWRGMNEQAEFFTPTKLPPIPGQEPRSSLPNLYIPVNNNYDEAVNMGFPVLNPDLNFEMNESVGSYYFFKPRPEGYLNQIWE